MNNSAEQFRLKETTPHKKYKIFLSQSYNSKLEVQQEENQPLGCFESQSWKKSLTEYHSRNDILLPLL